MVQWSRRIDELTEKGIRLVMVSIGKPEVGQNLVEHLELPNGENYLFVDPTNALYDALDLNRGVGRTFANINTPLAFLDRFTKPDGMKDLLDVLGKWSKAIYIPPERDQAFLQGGTFVFSGEQTLFAHYDPSTASHASIDGTIAFAEKSITS